MTANPTTTAQQPTETEYEAYLAEQEAAGEAAYAAYLADYEPPEAATADDWPEPDDDDLVSTRTWIRRHTVSDRDVANLTCELDAVEDSFRNEDVLIGYALSGDDVADRAKLDRSTAPYLRYLAARAGAVVDRIDEKYVGWVDAERLEPVRERALELMGRISGEVELVYGRRALPSLYISGADGYAALAERVRAECPDLAKRYTYTPYYVDDPMRDWPHGRPIVMVDRSFAEEYMVGGAHYATLAALVRQVHGISRYVEDDVDVCTSCCNRNKDGSCGSRDGRCDYVCRFADDDDVYLAMGIVTWHGVEIEVKCRELDEEAGNDPWDAYIELEDDDPADHIADEIMRETALMEDGETYGSELDSEHEIANTARELLLRFVRKAIERGVISSVDELH